MKKRESVRRSKVFISYSHKDRKWLERLQRHLKPLERDHAIEFWDDTKIGTGAKWRTEIEKALQSAGAAVLLISADFLASEFITSDELPSLLAAADEEGATILPVIVSPCRFLHTKSLSQFQALNSPQNPLIKMSTGERESLFVRLTEDIEKALNPKSMPAVPTEKLQSGRSSRKKTVDADVSAVRKLPKTQQGGKAAVSRTRQSLLPAKTVSLKPTATRSKSELTFKNTYKLAEADRINCVAFSPDGETLAAGTGGGGFFTKEGSVTLWAAATGRSLRTLAGHANGVVSIAFSPDGTTLASGAGDRAVRLWRVSDGELLHTFDGNQDTITPVAFSSDGYLASGLQNTVQIWRASEGKRLRSLQAGDDAIVALAFSPDGKMLAGGTFLRVPGVNDLHLWRVSDGKLLRTLRAHTSMVWALAFSPNGSLLASGGHDKMTCVWGVPDGDLLHSFKGFIEPVNDVAFSPDGGILALAIGGEFFSGENTVKFFHVPTNESAGVLTGHEKGVTGVAFSPDGSILGTSSYDKTLRLWEVNAESG